MEIINPSHIENWDQLVLASNCYSFFHSSMWHQVLTESYHYIPRYMCQIKGKKFVFLLPLIEVSSPITGRRGVSLPFTDFCDPIIDDNVPINSILNDIIELGKRSKWRYLELRTGKFSIPDNNKSTYFYRHNLNLTEDESGIFSCFSDNTQRNIKKAIREDLTIDISDTYESVKRYYYLHCLTRKRHGIPPQPLFFFRKIHQNIISKGYGFTILARHQQKIIGGAIYFHFGKKAIYKFGASDIRYKKYRSNNLIMWEAIKWYAKNKYVNFDFGRTESINDGLRRFKLGWGAQEDVVNYYKYDLKNNCYQNEKEIMHPPVKFLIKKMPIILSRMTGRLIYKHVG